MSAGLIERTLADLERALDHAQRTAAAAERRGLLQRLDPRTKLMGLGLVIVAAVSARNPWVLLALLMAVLGTALLCGPATRRIFFRVWVGVLMFTGVIALPALFLTPGRTVLEVGGVALTETGMRSAFFLLARAETAATSSVLLISTTPWAHLLKALRLFRVPVLVIVILGMTCRYIFQLCQTAREMFEARRSRWMGGAGKEMAAGSAGVLLSRSIQLGGEVHEAMRSRGFRGEVRTLDQFKMGARDGVALALCALAALPAFLWR